MRLTEDELVLYQEWIENNRELERLVKEMRGLSSRVLAFIFVGGGDRYRHPSDATSRPLTVPRLRLPAKKTRPITGFCKRLIGVTAWPASDGKYRLYAHRPPDPEVPQNPGSSTAIGETTEFATSPPPLMLSNAPLVQQPRSWHPTSTEKCQARAIARRSSIRPPETRSSLLPGNRASTSGHGRIRPATSRPQLRRNFASALNERPKEVLFVFL